MDSCKPSIVSLESGPESDASLEKEANEQLDAKNDSSRPPSSSQRHSSPGAYHVDTTGSTSTTEGLSTVPSELSDDPAIEHLSVSQITIPNATVVEESVLNAPVTVGQLVHADPVEVCIDGDEPPMDEINKKTRKKWPASRWRIYAMLVGMLVLALVVGLTTALVLSRKAANRTRDRPFPPPPQPLPYSRPRSNYNGNARRFLRRVPSLD